MTATAPTPAHPAVEFTRLELDRAGQTVLRTERWHLPAGEHALIGGASGSGKTTLLHLLAGLETGARGEIRILGTSFHGLGTRERDRFRGRHIGLVFQDFHLLAGLSVADNLRLPLWFAGVASRGHLVADLLDRLDVGALVDRQPHQLSHGEKQRVAIARAVINQPRLILADEPTSALDDDNATLVLDLLRAEAERADASLVVASHDQRLRANFHRQLILEAPR